LQSVFTSLGKPFGPVDDATLSVDERAIINNRNTNRFGSGFGLVRLPDARLRSSRLGAVFKKHFR
jgi:hypothetical protein